MPDVVKNRNNKFRKLSDEELLQEIEKINTCNEGTKARSAHYFEIMSIQGELNRRNTERQFKSTEKGMWVSIIFAVVSIIISLFIGYFSYKSSNDWQTKQIPEIKSITKNTQLIFSKVAEIKTRRTRNK